MEPLVFAVNDLAFGGAQRTVVSAANECQRRGIPVYVLTTIAEGLLKEMLTIPPDRIVHIPLRSPFSIQGIRNIAAFFKKVKPRAVISNLYFTNTAVTLSKLFYPALKVVIREGNMLHEKGSRARIVDIVLSPLVERVVVNADMLMRPMRLVHPFTKISVLYNGVSPEFFRERSNGDTLRDQLSIPRDATLVTTVGSLTEKKGHWTLINAWNRLQDPNAHLLIIGSGPLKEILQKHAAGNPRIHIIGARTDIADLYNASDIFVLPSYWEGMPNVLFEALAIGLPVIATSVGGVSEFLKDGENGIIVPPRDSKALTNALNEMIHSTETRFRMAHMAKTSVSRLTWEAHVSELLSVL